ncbi:MAG: biotin/lipoyl-binding protein [Patescibacteria group bacterium]|nr:biotin/lipoyl-binding protein [Patescibacteria group bacterium]
MKTFWLKLKTFRNLIIAIFVIVVLIAGFFIFSKQKSPDTNYVAVKRGMVTQEVSVTGKVKPAESVNLTFEKTGKISHIYADIGSRVSAGQTLAVISNNDIVTQINQAQAAIDSAQAKLDELKKSRALKISKSLKRNFQKPSKILIIITAISQTF